MGGRIGLSLFFFAFFAMGSMFVGLMVREAAMEAATYRWQPIECTVISSGVEVTDDDNEPYIPSITYRYVRDGRDFIGTKATRRHRGFASYDRAEALSIRFPPGAETTCFVDPARPERALMERRLPWAVVVLPLPLIFVAVGLGGIYVVWKKTPIRSDSESISSRARARTAGDRVAVALGGIFVVVGGGLFVAIGVLPAARLVEATSWTELPSTVLSSTVRSHDTDDGTTYRVDILYEYEVDGVIHRSNRHSFAAHGSSGYGGKRAVVDRYPRGSSTVCFVDPNDPYRSVLDRGFRPAYLVGLLPLVFLIAGAAVLRWGITRIRQNRTSRSTPGLPNLPFRHPEGVSGPAVMKASTPPKTRLIGSMLFGLIWNGLISVFVLQVIGGWHQGRPDVVLTVFMIPFVLVGLATVAFAIHSALALLNPRPIVTINPGTVRLGESFSVEWRFEGRAERIASLEIVVEGREEIGQDDNRRARSRRSVFARLPVATADNPPLIARGSTLLTIPEDSMHSFTAEHNKIVWVLTLRGSIGHWPDITEEFEFTVAAGTDSGDSSWPS